MKKGDVLLSVSNDVRVVYYDELNVVVERLETYYSPKEKKDVEGWKFKGYKDTILKALKFISDKELLVEVNDAQRLDEYIHEVETSNTVLLKAIEDTENKVKEG